MLGRVAAPSSWRRMRAQAPLEDVAGCLQHAASALLGGRVALNASRSIGARASTFAYVNPGPVAPRRHELEWNEEDRQTKWRHEGIPFLDDGVPDAARAKGVTGSIHEVLSEQQRSLHDLKSAHPELFYVALVAESLDASSVLSKDVLDELLAPPSAAEIAHLETPAGRHAALLQLRVDTAKLRRSFQLREEDALDSGELDFALPMSEDRREALQRENSKGVLVEMLRVARQASLCTFVQDKLLTPEQRAKLVAAAEDAQTSWVPHRTGLDPLDSSSSSSSGSADASDFMTREMSPEDLRDLGHAESYDATRRNMLENEDRLTFLPRKRLPVPLQADAPTAQLHDVARLLDENTSMTAEDKAYMLSYYADALAGKETAFTDARKEFDAWVKPQPEWGVYDPDLVRKTDRSHDALEGVGEFSREHGYTFAQELTPPKSAGVPDLNPSRTPLEAHEEVANVMRHYDVSAAREIATATATVTEALERSLGLPVGRISASADSRAQSKQLEAAKAKIAASTKQAPQQQQQKQTGGGKGKPGAAPPVAPTAVPGRVSDDLAEAMIQSFFSKYKAGIPMVTPPLPPVGGHRVIDAPYEDAAAAGKAAAGKGKAAKGKKK